MSPDQAEAADAETHPEGSHQGEPPAAKDKAHPQGSDQAEAHAQGSDQAEARPNKAHAQGGAGSDPPPPSHSDPHKPGPEERRPVKTRLVLLVLAVGAIAAAYFGITGRWHDDQKLSKWTQKQAIPPVTVVTPSRGGPTRELVLPGNVNAFYSASIHGQVKGYVSEWRKDIGAKVKQGDILAVVDTPELDQSIAVAQSEVAKAKANLALAKVTAARWDSLRATAAVSQQAADEKDSDERAQAAQVEAAQSNVDRLKAEKGFANIVAPFDGVVTARNVDVGSLVRADGVDTAPLFVVADVHVMRIYVPVPENYVAGLKDGDKATLEVPEYPGRSFDATIDTTARAIDPKSRTLLVELLANNADGALQPGAFTRVHFQIRADPDTFTIPAAAMIYRNTEPRVATVGANNRIVLKDVRVIRDLGTKLEIGGVGPDERIVTNPPDSIEDGEEVRVEAAGDKTNGATAQQPAEGNKAPPNGVDETAQTGRDHKE
jgi:RND family efflux transporter MFP subunit